MRTALLASAGVLAFTVVPVLGGVPPAQAANARNPYTNVDPRNDRGNNTGDYETERLNRMQLERGGVGPYYPAPPAPPPGYYAPRGYYPPPPAYYPPPGYPPPGYYPPRY